MGKLKVYKASAGSGKTFTLAVEYISMLVKKPDAYRNILAVTFTNKATEEMKTRIMSQLYGISKNLHSSKQYLKKIMENTGVEKKETVRKKCEQALSLMLHDYTNFRIVTIDAFFQTVLRNLAYEMDINPNLKVELDDKQAVIDATDIIIDELDTKNKVFTWLIRYIQSKINDEKSWNVIKDIHDFGKHVLEDEFRTRQDEIEESMKNPKDTDDYIDMLRKCKKECIDTMAGFAKRYLDIMEEAGIPENLEKWDRWSNKASGVAGYFKKLHNLEKKPIFDEKEMVKKRVREGMEGPDTWVGKDKIKNQYRGLVVNELIPLLIEAEETRKKMYKLYVSADVTLRNINEMRLLKTIGDKVREINRKTNRIQLSDTQFLLNNMIGANDSPFIYEKIGTRIENIMIDEFQDTSKLQWENFKVLLNECLSHESSNLIVGDVKQSIYRWRNGDWRILNDIEKEINGAEEKHLNTNYRSQDNIVNFNNAFFTAAEEIERKKLEEITGDNDTGKYTKRMKKAYEDVKQETSKNNGKGLVKATFVLNKGKVEDEDGEPVKDIDMLKALADNICMLLDNGIQQQDIAILIRENKVVPVIADYFSNPKHSTKHNIKIVSNEAFQLKKSKIVNSIMDAMRHIADYNDKVAEASVNQEFSEGEIKEIKKLSSLPLYDMAEEIFKIISQRQGYSEDNGENAYVCAFFDQLASFIENYTADINDFIRQWDNNLADKTIQDNNTDGIRIMTLHKSKGLEFDNVIIPYCDWDVNRGSLMWCQPTVEPFDKMKWVTIKYKNELKESIYNKEYFEETMQTTVDNLNMLYVAFTRAAKNLFFICRDEPETNNHPRQPAETSRAKTIKDVLEKLCSEDNTSGVKMKKEEDGDNIIYSFGDLAVNENKEEKKSDEAAINVFTEIPTPETIGMKAYTKLVNFLQSNDSKRFMRQDEGTGKKQEYIDTGNTIHELLSGIYTIADIDKRLREFEQKGLLDKSSPRTKEIINQLKDRINDSKAQEWFKPGWQTFNECSILCLNPDNGKMERKRPDRVITNGKKTIVIDFKTGKEKETEYSRQVREYMQLLKDMGHSDIEGYLWYLNTGNIVTVNL